MGFDITVQLCFHMCNKTGKPYYYNYKKNLGEVTRIYEMPSIEVPEHLREYLVGRGPIFHAYTDNFNERDVYLACVDQFLEYYPTWTDVTNHSSFSEEDTLSYWKEEDHNKFKELLEWCAAQDVAFQVSWCY